MYIICMLFRIRLFIIIYTSIINLSTLLYKVNNVFTIDIIPYIYIWNMEYVIRLAYIKT